MQTTMYRHVATSQRQRQRRLSGCGGSARAFGRGARQVEAEALAKRLDRVLLFDHEPPAPAHVLDASQLGVLGLGRAGEQVVRKAR